MKSVVYVCVSLCANETSDACIKGWFGWPEDHVIVAHLLRLDVGLIRLGMIYLPQETTLKEIIQLQNGSASSVTRSAFLLHHL